MSDSICKSHTCSLLLPDSAKPPPIWGDLNTMFSVWNRLLQTAAGLNLSPAPHLPISTFSGNPTLTTLLDHSPCPSPQTHRHTPWACRHTHTYTHTPWTCTHTAGLYPTHTHRGMHTQPFPPPVPTASYHAHVPHNLTPRSSVTTSLSSCRLWAPEGRTLSLLLAAEALHVHTPSPRQTLNSCWNLPQREPRTPRAGG